MSLCCYCTKYQDCKENPFLYLEIDTGAYVIYCIRFDPTVKAKRECIEG